MQAPKRYGESVKRKMAIMVCEWSQHYVKENPIFPDVHLNVLNLCNAIRLLFQAFHKKMLCTIKDL